MTDDARRQALEELPPAQRSLVAELLNRVDALEHAIRTPPEVDPAQAGFETFRGRARAREERQAKEAQG